jgi:hypothetical protein
MRDRIAREVSAGSARVARRNRIVTDATASGRGVEKEWERAGATGLAGSIVKDSVRTGKKE